MQELPWETINNMPKSPDVGFVHFLTAIGKEMYTMILKLEILKK